MTQPTYRAAIIGVGRIGNTYDDEVVDRRPASYYQGENRQAGLYVVLPVNHAEAYQTTPGFTLVAAANRGLEKLTAFGERRGIKALYTDFRQLLRDEAPDVVSICTQSPEKMEVAVAAAEAGVKAIVLEKAVATSMAEADAILAACERHGVLLTVNHPNRFSPLVRKTKELIDAGALGELTSVTVHAGGGMMHIGTHMFDLMRYWAGDAVELYAQVPNYAPEQDLPALGIVRFANGMTGLFDHTHRDQQCLEVRGRDGYITVSSMVGDGWLYQFESTQPPTAKRQYPHRLTVQPLISAPHDLSPTQRLLAELHTSLSTGAPLISTGRDGAAALEMGLACYASHVAGKPVPLPLAERTLRVPNR
ncbi:MAG: Gfo/Idh/MocA family oxidoreductase [Caldilineaceae bacterium]|nr:Gfo/Idh/MocA family oxidoreductase [Caldilineaceae bacterium]